MADDEKPKKKGMGSLYDRSEMGGSEKVTERERVTERKAAAKEPAEGEGGDEKEKPKAEGGSEKAKPKTGEATLTAFREMTKRHETERGDTHNAHRDAMRQMHKRHQGELGSFFDRMGDNGEEAPADGAAAAAPAAAATEA